MPGPGAPALARTARTGPAQRTLLPRRLYLAPPVEPALSAAIQRLLYDLLFRATAQTMLEVARQPQAPRSQDRLPQHPAHLGTEPAIEPSLMMPGIIISFIFNKQGRRVSRTTPLQNQLPCAEKPVDNALNCFVIQIRTTNLPGSANSDLFTL